MPNAIIIISKLHKIIKLRHSSFGGIIEILVNNLLTYLLFGGIILVVKIGGVYLGEEELQTNGYFVRQNQ